MQKKKRGKTPIIGVMGGVEAENLSQAFLLGKKIAEKGYILLTGGGPGVMEAASKGAFKAGGLVIGVLPNERQYPLEGYPNRYVDIPIYTGMSDARNAINVKTSNVIVAFRGGAGTLSEIALAIKSGTPVVCLDCSDVDIETRELFVRVSSVKEVMKELERFLRRNM